MSVQGTKHVTKRINLYFDLSEAEADALADMMQNAISPNETSTDKRVRKIVFETIRSPETAAAKD